MSDKVFVKDLEIEAIIGIFDWEREVKQPVSYTHLTLPTKSGV